MDLCQNHLAGLSTAEKARKKRTGWVSHGEWKSKSIWRQKTSYSDIQVIKAGVKVILWCILGWKGWIANLLWLQFRHLFQTSKRGTACVNVLLLQFCAVYFMNSSWTWSHLPPWRVNSLQNYYKHQKTDMMCLWTNFHLPRFDIDVIYGIMNRCTVFPRRKICFLCYIQTQLTVDIHHAPSNSF